jgi:hypothetical protein
VNRVVEMLLPVKGDGAWRIVCQAWDRRFREADSG